MALWYAQLSTCNFNDVSSGTTSSVWNSAANGSGSWLDLSADFSADTFRANAKTAIALNVNVTCAQIDSVSSSGTYLITTTGVTLTANLLGGNTSTFLMNAGTPSVTIVGNVTGGTAACVNISVAGTLTVTGTVTGGSSSGHGITCSAAATITVTGNVTGGSSGSAYGLNVTSGTASVSVTGTLSAATGPGFFGSNTPTITVTSGNIVDTGTVYAITGSRSLIYVPGIGNYYRARTTGSTTVDLVYGSGSGAGAWTHRMIGGGF